MEKSDPTRELLNQLLSDLEGEVDLQRRLEERQSFVLAADGRFLGRITSSGHPESLLNVLGVYGSVHSELCIFNHDSPYGSINGTLSVRNPGSMTPPLLFVNGEFWGVVSDNPRPFARVISPDRFWNALLRDWQSFERGEFSDSGAIHVHAAP